ncbi:glutathione S-transferase family protein [Aspergillus undulatus]|uniref:glutathione S-transferase family protein n=1 Tax=Aspergillus undulatus TaxID=1810928 RepID=UPI003CCD2240
MARITVQPLFEVPCPARSAAGGILPSRDKYSGHGALDSRVTDYFTIELKHTHTNTMAFGTIYSYPHNPRVSKIQAVANINGLTIESGEFEFHKTNKSPEFLAKFPSGKAPAFESADGVTLFESNAIAHFVAESGPAKEQLLGSSPAERARIQQWVTFSETEVASHVVTCFLPRFGLVPYNKETDERALGNLERTLETLERHLNGKSWLATGEKLSLADIAVASALIWGFMFSVDAEMREKYPVVVAWWKRVTESEGVKEAFGETKFVEKRTVPEAK